MFGDCGSSCQRRFAHALCKQPTGFENSAACVAVVGNFVYWAAVDRRRPRVRGVSFLAHVCCCCSFAYHMVHTHASCIHTHIRTHSQKQTNNTQFEALHDVSSVEAALVYTLEPVLGAMIAWALLGERWGAWGWVGAALIVGSSFVTQVYGAEPEEKAGGAATATAASNGPVSARVGETASKKTD